MTTQSERHEELVKECAAAISARVGPAAFGGVAERASRAILVLVAERLADVTEEQLDASLAATGSWLDIKGSGLTVAREKMRRRLIAWLSASALGNGGKEI